MYEAINDCLGRLEAMIGASPFMYKDVAKRIIEAKKEMEAITLASQPEAGKAVELITKIRDWADCEDVIKWCTEFLEAHEKQEKGA